MCWEAPSFLKATVGLNLHFLVPDQCASGCLHVLAAGRIQGFAFSPVLFGSCGEVLCLERLSTDTAPQNEEGSSVFSVSLLQEHVCKNENNNRNKIPAAALRNSIAAPPALGAQRPTWQRAPVPRTAHARS